MKSYFKVETRTQKARSKHIEKDFFETHPEALAEFKMKDELVATQFYRGQIKSYIIALAEVFPDENRTVVHSIRKAPL